MDRIKVFLLLFFFYQLLSFMDRIGIFYYFYLSFFLLTQNWSEGHKFPCVKDEFGLLSLELLHFSVDSFYYSDELMCSYQSWKLIISSLEFLEFLSPWTIGGKWVGFNTFVDKSCIIYEIIDKHTNRSYGCDTLMSVFWALFISLW